MKKESRKTAAVGKNRKPIYKKWWFWLLIAALLFGAKNTNNDVSRESEPECSETAVETTVAHTEETAEPATVATEAAETAEKQTTYVLNTNSKKFHYASCGSAEDIKDSNKSQFTGIRDDLLSKGYTPCSRCHP